MCGRYVLEDATQAFEAILHENRPTQLPLELSRPRYNIAPTQPVPVVRLAPGSRHPEVVALRWGLVPSWSKELGGGALLINARAETVASKPSFRAAYQQRRCLLPASGFYEWAKVGKAKQPYYFHRADGQPYCFAGIWERWERDGLLVESCALITTEANSVVAPVHDRMPVMLRQDDWERWLTSPTAEGLESLLVPLAAGEMTAHPVSPAVNNARSDEASMIAPVNSA